MPARDPAESRLEAETLHHRERLVLYRARVYNSRATGVTRLRELECSYRAANARLLATQGR